MTLQESPTRAGVVVPADFTRDREPVYEIACLESEIGKPVVRANQAGIWAFRPRLGVTAIGPGQVLCGPTGES